MKKYVLLIVVIFALQSCYYPVKKDYNGFSKTLVFSKGDKWLINTIQTDVSSHHKEMMNKELLSFFSEMSNGNAKDLTAAKSENLILNRIPTEPEIEDLESLKNSTDFSFLVNVYTFKVKKDLDRTIGEQFEYKRNETFAIMDVYDLKTLKKIYSYKAYSEVSVDKNQKATIFTPTTEMMTMKNFRSLLKSVKKNAIKN